MTVQEMRDWLAGVDGQVEITCEGRSLRRDPVFKYALSKPTQKVIDLQWKTWKTESPSSDRP